MFGSPRCVLCEGTRIVDDTTKLRGDPREVGLGLAVATSLLAPPLWVLVCGHFGSSPDLDLSASRDAANAFPHPPTPGRGPPSHLTVK